MTKNALSIDLRYFGRCRYSDVYSAMRQYSYTRNASSADQLWLLEHEPVYTVGRRAVANLEQFATTRAIPVMQTDRGGQFSYHGPGQAILYTLIDLRRLGIGVKFYVTILEDAIMRLLANYGIRAHRIQGAAGVYISRKKVASLGLNIRNGCCYHGVALNVDMDLTPFADITPCGLTGIEMTQLANHLKQPLDTAKVGYALADILSAKLNYTHQTRDWSQVKEFASLSQPQSATN